MFLQNSICFRVRQLLQTLQRDQDLLQFGLLNLLKYSAIPLKDFDETHFRSIKKSNS